jgi:GTP pyrophosphokinase
VIAKAFGDSYAALAIETNKLVRVQQQARGAEVTGHLVDDPRVQTENVRKMLLAFSRDLRVVMLRLASRLQTLRWYAATKRPARPAWRYEALHVFAPLANRLGIWQVKWEMEDLAFRFLEPETYKRVAGWLDEKRVEREDYVERLRTRARGRTEGTQGIGRRCTGGPKHIYSIVKKMRGKSLDFAQVLDVRALRVIVPDVNDCYAALAWVHSRFSPILEEFDDYIARPKPNGYQSLHTVVRDGAGRPIEIQIRTQPCTTTPSTAWRRTGPTRRPGRRAMPAWPPAASTTPRSRCCASCWRGSATWPVRPRACSTTASTC